MSEHSKQIASLEWEILKRFGVTFSGVDAILADRRMLVGCDARRLFTQFLLERCLLDIPVACLSEPKQVLVADAFDFAQERLGSPLRAFRWSREAVPYPDKPTPPFMLGVGNFVAIVLARIGYLVFFRYKPAFQSELDRLTYENERRWSEEFWASFKEHVQPLLAEHYTQSRAALRDAKGRKPQ